MGVTAMEMQSALIYTGCCLVITVVSVQVDVVYPGTFVSNTSEPSSLELNNTIDVDGKTIALGGSKYPAFLTKFPSKYSNATIQLSQEKLSPAKVLETPIYRLKLKPSDPQYVLFRRNNRIRTYNTSLAKGVVHSTSDPDIDILNSILTGEILVTVKT